MRARWVRLSGACLLPLLVGCGGDRPRPAAEPPRAGNVLVITIDTLRADRLGRGFTPTLDRLARAGLSFTQARTPVPLTLPAHATMLSGLLPLRHGVRENGVARFEGHPTLATVLKQHGYETGATVAAFVLAARFGLNAGFDEYDDHVPREVDGTTQLEAQRDAAAVTQAAVTTLARLSAAPSSAPPARVFLWVHYYDPHAPYTPPQEHRARAGGRDYDGEVAYVDAEVARLLVRLREHPSFRLRDTLLVVAGDHGEGLGEHGENTHGLLLHDATLRVPLVFTRWNAAATAPRAGAEDFSGVGDGPAGVRGARSEPVSLADLAPTVLGALGLEIPPGLDGVNLLDPSGPREIYAETQYPRVAGWSPLTALVADGRKLIRGGRVQLFDLASDPGEARDVSGQRPGLAAAMDGRLREISAVAVPPVTPPSAETRERLRALGYVAASASAVPAGAPDPADRIAEWNAFEDAAALGASRRATAIARLRGLAARNPDASAFLTTLARLLGEAGRRREALAAYRHAVARWPGDPVLMHDLAVAARDAGEMDEALRAEQAALALRPGDPAALNGLGLLHVAAGRIAEATSAFEQALAGQPDPAYASHLGNARRALGDIDGARRAYEAALTMDGTWPDAANGLGVLLVQQGRPTEAIGWLEKSLARSPDFIEARLNLGIACQEAGRVECAGASYRAVLRAGVGHAREKAAAAELLRQLARRPAGGGR